MARFRGVKTRRLPTTEQEWLSCRDPLAMLESVARLGGTNDRIMRLFACACARLLWGLLPGEAERVAVEVAERYADGLADEPDLRYACGRVSPARGAGEDIRLVVRAAANTTQSGPRSGAVTAAKTAVRAGGAVARCNLIRCIFGHPFRPAAAASTLDPACRTTDVASLALAGYEERALPSGELDRQILSILADALEDAGCTNRDALAHLREPGPHVRGCWAVDLCLG